MSQLIMKHPDFQPENVKFDTVEVHAGEPRDPYGSLIPPIYQTSTFYFDSTDDAVEACSDYAESFAYSRITNPSLDYMEQKLAALEHGKGAVSYASGMGAVAGALFAALKCGDHVIFTKAKYSGTEDITSDWLPRFGIEHDSFRADHLEELEPLIKPNTKVIYVETPANPTMVLVDIAAVVEIAHKHGIKVFIDNTFATSIIAKPIKYGADLVIYSATKYLGGHDDLVGGAVVGSEEIIKSLSFYLGLYGANLGATESWLLARSLRTLPLRVKKMAENGLALAKFFESHPKVEKVYYPGLESSPSKALADKQFEGNGYGGMLCVNFKGGQKEIDKLISNLQLVRFVPTLAGVGTTLTYPPRASHRDLSPDELAAIGITMGQIRLSSGLEDTDDLLNDFDQALAKM